MFKLHGISKKIICAILTLIFSLQILITPEMISHGAVSTTVSFNDKNLGVSVSGYSAVSEGTYTFSSELVFSFNATDDTAFNRYTIEYSSNACIGGTVYYKLNNRTRSEDFFIEGGKDMSFSSLIDGYLNSKKAKSISKITFEPLSRDSATLKVNAVKTMEYAVYDDETAYIENERFKVGCCLIWGGGLNYIEDKKDNDRTVSNMLNHCDTGRLVQQSYYGTSEAPYDPGFYNGSVWGYNPVQGGDQHNNKSKLVDFVITSDTIYVKCRPLDWSKNNEYTFSYMENVYKLEKDCIKVDNRFIDFSGYNHGLRGRHQELPAFYTISYLDTFTFYNGSKPWTGAELTVKDNLPFWGDSANQSQCYFNMKKGNTETWCSWTSSEKGYGIGLYTPSVSILLAGRHAYNGSKDPADGATNYVAPLITNIMRNYEPFQYSYYITAGTVESIRSTFTEKKTTQDFVDISFDTTKLAFDDSFEIGAFSGLNEVTLSHDADSGSAVYNVPSGSSTKRDTYAYVGYPSKVNTKDYRYIVFSYMVPTTNQRDNYKVEFFVCAGSRTKAESGYSYREALIVDGKFHTIIVDMWQVKASSGENLWPSTGEKLNQIRLDFEGARTNDKLYIAGFGLAGSKSQAEAYATDFIKPGSSTDTTPGVNPDNNIVIPSVNPEQTPGGVINPDSSNSDNSSNSGNSGNSGTTSPTEKPDNNIPGGTEEKPGTDSDNINNTESDLPSDETTDTEDEIDASDEDIDLILIIGFISLGVLLIAAVVVLIIVFVKKKKTLTAANVATATATETNAVPLTDDDNECSLL